MTKKIKLQDSSEHEVPIEVYNAISSQASYHLTREVKSALSDFFGSDANLDENSLTENLRRMVSAAKKINDSNISTSHRVKELELALESSKSGGGVEKLKQQLQTEYETKLKTELEQKQKEFEKTLSQQMQHKSFLAEVKAHAIQRGLKEFFTADSIFETLLNNHFEISSSSDGTVYAKNKKTGTYAQDANGNITPTAVVDEFYKLTQNDLFRTQQQGYAQNIAGNKFNVVGGINRKASEMSSAEIQKLAEAELLNSLK